MAFHTVHTRMSLLNEIRCGQHFVVGVSTSYLHKLRALIIPTVHVYTKQSVVTRPEDIMPNILLIILFSYDSSNIGQLFS